MEFDPTTHPPYSVRTLAERWQCSPSMIRKLIKQGKLGHFRIGELIRIPRAAVEEYENGATAVASVADAMGQLAGESTVGQISAVRRIGRKPREQTPLRR